MAGETIPLTFRAEIGNLTKELGKIPGITDKEAKRMAIALERQVKKSEMASKAANKRKTADERRAAATIIRLRRKVAADSAKAAEAARRAQIAAGKAIVEATKKAAKEKQAAAEKTAAHQDRLNAATIGAWKKVGAGAVAAITSTTVAIAALVQATADQRNAIADMSARTGVAGKTLAGLRLAAEGSGRSFEDMNEVINPLVARLGQVHAGSKTAEDAFGNLGVSVRDSNGDIVSNDEALRRVAERLQSIQDPSQKAATAVGLLGESGGKLIQVLGDTGLDTFTNQAARFGLDVGPEAAASASNLQSSLADMSLIIGGAVGTFTDLIDAVGLLDAVNVGLVHQLALIQGQMTNVGAAGAGLSAVFSGQVKSMADWADVTSGAGAKSMAEISQAATRATAEYVVNTAAIRAGKAAATAATPALDTLGQTHAAAATAAKDQAAAENQLAGVFKLAMDAVDALADSTATEAELAEHAADRKIAAIRDAVAATKEGSNERLQAEIAASAGIAAIETKLAADVSKIRKKANDEALAEYAATAATWESMVNDLNAHNAQSSKESADQQIEDNRRVESEVVGVFNALGAAGVQAFNMLAQVHTDNMTLIMEQREMLSESIAQSSSELDAANEAFLNATTDTLSELEQARRAYSDAVSGMTKAEIAEAAAAGDIMTAKELSDLDSRINSRRSFLEEEVAASKVKDDELRAAAQEESDKAFKLQQSAAALSIIMNTAAGIMQAYGQLGPIGGTIAGVIVTALGVAQGVVVANQTPPKIAHDGEVISPVQAFSSSPAPDEVDRRLKRGEAVLNSRLVQGNEDAINEANRTGQMPGSSQVAVHVGGRFVGEFLAKEMRGEGPLARATRKRAPSARSVFR